MLAESSSRREDTDGELGEGETGEGWGGGQGEDSATAGSKEGQEVADEDEVDGLLEGPGSSRLFTLEVSSLKNIWKWKTTWRLWVDW